MTCREHRHVHLHIRRWSEGLTFSIHYLISSFSMHHRYCTTMRSSSACLYPMWLCCGITQNIDQRHSMHPSRSAFSSADLCPTTYSLVCLIPDRRPHHDPQVTYYQINSGWDWEHRCHGYTCPIWIWDSPRTSWFPLSCCPNSCTDTVNQPAGKVHHIPCLPQPTPASPPIYSLRGCCQSRSHSRRGSTISHVNLAWTNDEDLSTQALKLRLYATDLGQVQTPVTGRRRVYGSALHLCNPRARPRVPISVPQ